MFYQKKKTVKNPYLSIEQDMAEVPNDIGQFNDLFPAFLKLCCYTVALADVPAHLWHIKMLRKCLRNHFKQYNTHWRAVTTGESVFCNYFTCTAMSSGLLDAVNTATHRERASNNT